MMRRSRLHRVLGVLVSAWFALHGATAGLRSCAMHSTTVGAAHTARTSHDADAAHDAHAGHGAHDAPGAGPGTTRPASDTSPPPAPAGCDCRAPCCGVLPVVLGITATIAEPVTVATAAPAPRDASGAPAAGRARLLPFANGPPAALRG